jgi:hypothetical protein
MTNHPIIPPPELLDQWCMENNWRDIATQAAQWGADQELEACCDVMRLNGAYVSGGVLRAIRRPKPPSEAEHALEIVNRIEKSESPWAMSELDTIRRALERLQQLEAYS